MKTFKVTYHDDTNYVTSASDQTTQPDFVRYLKQAPHVTENELTGKETVRYVTHVEELPKE